MLNERLKLARDVQSHLMPAEVMSHDALTQALKLGLAICNAHSEAGLPMHVGQAEIDEVTAAITHFGQGRARLINAHRALAETRDIFLPGVPTRMIGDNWNCPPASGSLESDQNASPVLRAVG
jgi:hypothetical protein